MRKLLMLAAMALAALAVSAPSALAAQPHNDYDVENWSGVLALADSSTEQYCENEYYCDFADDGFSWHAYTLHPIFGPYDLGGCYPTIDGAVTTSGGVHVEVVSGDCFNQGSLQLVKNDDWVGQACYHEPTGEVWFRQQVKMTNGSTVWDGAMFGLHDNDANDADGYGIQFGGPTAMIQFPSSAYQVGNATQFPLEGEIEFVPDAEQGDCIWPELV